MKFICLFFVVLVVLTFSFQSCAFIERIVQREDICEIAFRTCNLFVQINRHLAEQDTCKHYTAAELEILKEISGLHRTQHFREEKQ